jgi:outer membrane protein assembly factor BamB
MVLREGLTAVLVLLTGGLAMAQGDKDRLARREAQRLVTFLEIPERKREAARGLLRLGKDAVPALTRAINHPRSEVVCSCVQILRMLGHHSRSALPSLEKLAKDKDVVRAHAGRWGVAGVRDLGITQVTEINKDRIVEFDAKGKQIREIVVGEQIYDADRLANGNYLVCLLKQGKVVEIDAKGKIVWETTECKNPLDADRLPNGHTIIAGGKKKRVVEVDRDGKFVWEWKGTNWPNDADRLPSGNTLVVDSPARKIFEVDPAGKVVWSHDTGGGVIDAERLANGNTLFVRSSGKGVVEVDPKGKVVWEYTRDKPHSAMRASDGSTVIAGNDVVLLDEKGKEVWRQTGLGQIKAVHRY